MTTGIYLIKELKEQIANLKKRWPNHSVPIAMMTQLDDLEEELRREEERIVKIVPPIVQARAMFTGVDTSNIREEEDDECC